MSQKQSLTDELLIHSLITDVVLVQVKRIKGLDKLERTDILALEKFAKIYSLLMNAAGVNKKLDLFSSEDQESEA